MLINLLFIITLAQEPPRKVALTINGRVEIVLLADAQAEFAQLDSLKTRTVEQSKRHAALNLTLGTVFDLQRVRKDWEATGNKWEGPI